MKPIRELKKLLQNQRTSTTPIVRRTAQPIYNMMRGCKRFFTDSQHRCVTLLKLFKPKQIHQTTTLTVMNRYPLIFSACRDYFGDKEDLKILSFGCSTGEEVVSLRHYFPSAFITGAEINPLALAVCKERDVDDRIEFIDSDYRVIKQSGPFDAIFCMAVLQRTPHQIMDLGIQNLKKIYPFDKFDRTVNELDLCLKKNGLLIIHHSQYIFSDTLAADNYEPLSRALQEVDDNAKFNRDSLRIENPDVKSSIFVKKSGRDNASLFG